MFPTFDTQHAETVGARKARKAREEESTRRASSSTSQSSGSTRDSKACNSSVKPAKTSIFGWGSKKKNREIQEISPLSSLNKSQSSPEPAPVPVPVLEPEPAPQSPLIQEHFVGQVPSPTSLPPFGGLPPPPPSPGLEPSSRGTCLILTMILLQAIWEPGWKAASSPSDRVVC